MTQNDKQRARLISLLKELFQLDQPDLDFGLYRIMHAKADQVSRFLEDDLLKIIQDAFGEADTDALKTAEKAYADAREKAKADGVPEEAIENFKPVQQAKAALGAVRNADTHEGDVYDHLYRFFERYYDAGDFMSRRYFARETDGKAAPYAVPYDGREVYLHWANRDQYYIKTSEYLTNFTFDPTKAPEHPKLDTAKPMTVHSRIVSASEGEHNNVKASEQTERFFLIHEAEPVKLETNEAGEPELVLQFEYRADPKKSGQSGTWAKKRLEEAAQAIKAALPKLEGAEAFTAALMTPAPTEKQKDRTLLEKYLAQYTARNTMDYFIHKDLGGFLRRELDFYIKNEIMRLDDIETADAPQVEAYLARVKVLRRIARHLIDFLAQLEDFQKKLWLKKKFVTDTQYCITLDRIPEDFYPEIAANDAQREEWVRLFAIDDLDGYSTPLTVDFLKANDKLLIDTALFGADFRDQMVAEMQGLDAGLGGLLIHSENFQAIRHADRKLKRTVKCTYIDPPYNAATSEILYKNAYKHSSWVTLMRDRMLAAQSVMSEDGSMVIAIDENEVERLGLLIDDCFPNFARTCVSVIHNKKGIQGSFFSYNNEFAYFILPPSLSRLNETEIPEADWDYSNLRNWGTESLRTDARNCFYPIFVKGDQIVGVGPVSDDDFHPESANIEQEDGTIAVYPIDKEGVERKWRYAQDTVGRIVPTLKVEINGKGIIQIKKPKTHDKFKTVWDRNEYIAGDFGTKVLTNMGFPKGAFDFPKSVHTVKDSIFAVSGTTDITFDFFAGSGTTAQAVLDLNGRDGGARKYVLAEMGDYFDKVTRPRVTKAAYSLEWKDGKPVSRDGLSHAFKYLRLESYEDTLNNLALRPSPDLGAAGEDFSRDYMLKYWLDFETKGSPSLLNIQTFDDPTDYRLNIKTPGTDEYTERAIDLVETLNWLIGLHVEHLDRWRGFDATFKREPDPELPKDETTRLIVDGKLTESDAGKWRFRKVEGYTLTTPGDDTSREKTLVIWRVLTGNLEEDNLMLDEWFRKYRLSTQDTEFDVIFVNGSNNLPNLRQEGESWKVRLLEEAFHQAMWDVEG
ncbi:DNA methyltransferase [Parvularcula marina]|uniref:site-specific DNA-methyltransferase (adenine-specific) n=1 Tax=Parvularcula marina TaxID=2292771 RepID=A0A371R7J8_9PROT|nr:site-specific DNA-methyltransferase [Parvularcula marina]RFB01407.1 site-specific DNA-methyltransferase [Parvularcula marina]